MKPAHPPQQHVEDLVQPMTPAKVLKQKIHHLTQYERTEILDYPQVYYFGEGIKKIKPNMN